MRLKGLAGSSTDDLVQCLHANHVRGGSLLSLLTNHANVLKKNPKTLEK